MIVAAASMLATLGANIYNRERFNLTSTLRQFINHLAAIEDIKLDLHATDPEIALSLSIFTLIQGGAPLFWSVVSEIKGRKVRK